MVENKLLSVIIPCFNEEEVLESYLSQMKRIEQELYHSEHLDFEYVFIDDGSTDGTLAVMKDFVLRFDNVHYISFSRNFGKEAALLAGLENVKGDYITVMDADLQDPPELLPEMYNKIKNGYDVVGTRRNNRAGEPIIRSLFATLFYRIINMISAVNLVDGARDFRLMTRQVVDSILDLKEVNRFSKGLFAWVGYHTDYITYENRERIAGKTSWSFWGLVKYSFDGIINFSDVLLNLSTWSGFVSCFLSVIGIIVIIVRKLTIGGSVSGWASLVCIILLIGGIQLLVLGIIGKYMAKIFLETKKRPIYVIKEQR